uniref:Putative LAGLIDADG homing endonuclease n=1 Tax=Lobochlamys segnis TaxID=52035 RepID=A0A0S2IC01_9CHLO|nr:putative LAGLIDADG homing endonuclease [Lobochlamys segnis]
MNHYKLMSFQYTLQRRLIKIKLDASETGRKAPMFKKKLNFVYKLSSAKKSLFLGLAKSKENNSFNFTDYIKNHSPSHVKKPNVHFLEWFVGMSEGDGCFFVRKSGNRFRLSFQIAQKEAAILKKLRTQIGFGRVYRRKYFSPEGKEINYSLYNIDDKRNIQRLISLFNGNLILPKRRDQFNRWINYAKNENLLPKNFINKQSNIHQQGPSISLEDAWLSGFIDAEGCFYAKFSPASELKNKLTLKQKLHITQKGVFGEEKILAQIGNLFSSKSKVCLAFSKRKQLRSDSGSQNKYYRIEISSLESHNKIVSYLNKFKLRTVKIRAFQKWSNIVLARNLKAYLDAKRIPGLIKACQKINSQTKELKNKHTLNLYGSLE